MSYITPAQFKKGLQKTKDYADSKILSSGAATYVNAYIVGEYRSPNWLSLTENGEALEPKTGALYIINTVGNYYGSIFQFDDDINEFTRVGKKNIRKTPVAVDGTRKENTIPIPANSTRDTTDRVTVVEYPIIVGDEFDVYFKYKYGISGQIYIMVGDYEEELNKNMHTSSSAVEDGTYEKHFVVTSDMLGNGDVFKIQIAGWPSYAWNNGFCEIKEGGSINGTFSYRESETYEYIPVTDTEDGQSGLVPSVSKDTKAEALTPKGWGDIDFDITKDDVSSLFGQAYGEPNPTNNVYSTEESAIATWINGKTIYRRSFRMTGIDTSTSELIDASNWDIDEVIKLGGTVTIYEDSNIFTDIFPTYANNTRFLFFWYRPDTKFFNLTGSSSHYNSSSIFNFTIEYTKTTD